MSKKGLMEIEWLQGTCLAIAAVKEPPSEEKP